MGAISPSSCCASKLAEENDPLMPHIQIATPADLASWLLLAAEVEPLFGPMVNEASFHAALANNFQRGTAYCIREQDGPPGPDGSSRQTFRLQVDQ